ncbi:MAG: DnaJ C-terminal domain-containing protein [Armatimonadota bacterium]|nr:DnaJ C-terminal domain-containing protein [Armatimonadota bacterium]MDR7463803.1 DnaJ C-terminal domain-containing protein [Armatimonadota bacterium]MDR7469452.1 DnaJ C-terminal domain-containing protein [Armatimonadota bacterium]MDR7473842.1 DnaJ C-terminal domain-containing protein [Armatimonadota bacterium]MDR7539099.1 DnaJ C-terminal domain-containing protein [Armatimonadota bacterium]
MEFKDYYRILGVEPTADAKTISRAYKRLARQYHPDVNKAAGAEERFKEINEAYQVLGDAQKRARYDQIYEAYRRGGVHWQELFRGVPGGWAQAPGGFTVTIEEGNLEDLLGFSDFFRQFFGGGAVSAARGRGSRGGPVGVEELLRQAAGSSRTEPAAEASLEISLEEAFRGAQKSVTLRLDGRSRRLDVTIPRGIRSGQKIRLPGALDGSDVYLTVTVRPHALFVRQGDDVQVEVPVALTEALLGAEIEVPTLEGKVSMKIPAETQNGQTFRLRGLGMPRPGGGRGDQLVRVKVVLPVRLSEQERRVFEEMRQRRRENPRESLGLK